MKRNTNYYLRKVHRYLGVFIGIQFILWTVGGLYFSWNDIDKVHGDHLRQQVPLLPADVALVSPDSALYAIRESGEQLDSLLELKLISLLGKPVWRISYLTSAAGRPQTVLADATTGKLREAVTEEEARTIARRLFVPDEPIAKVEYLTQTGPHSEYREKPLPAWAVHFDHPDEPVIYIGALTGTFESIRHNTWRNFDLLWMLHTMDYESRDEFGNWLLKTFSVLGLITVLSGFVLFYVSSPSVRKVKKKFFSKN